MGKFQGEFFVFQIGGKIPPDTFFCAIRAMSCSLASRNMFFIRELLVQVRTRLSASAYPKIILLCIRCVSQGLWFLQLYTRHLNMPKCRNPPPPPRPRRTTYSGAQQRRGSPSWGDDMMH